MRRRRRLRDKDRANVSSKMSQIEALHERRKPSQPECKSAVQKKINITTAYNLLFDRNRNVGIKL